MLMEIICKELIPWKATDATRANIFCAFLRTLKCSENTIDLNSRLGNSLAKAQCDSSLTARPHA